MSSPSQFPPNFITELEKLFHWRRDVRHFQSKPVGEDLLNHLLSVACTAPSVGLSQPWRYIKVESTDLRQQIYSLFKNCNEDAAKRYASDEQLLYSNLKLSGLNEAPHHIAVFSEENPSQGKGLGRQTMPETTAYSTVMSIFTFWLAARAYDIGVGWVSILSPEKVKSILTVPDHWDFIAYLCVGYPQFQYKSPELEQKGWEKRNPDRCQWIVR